MANLEHLYVILQERGSDGALKSEDSYEGIGETELTLSIRYTYENGVLISKEWYDCLGDTCTVNQKAIYTFDEKKRIKSIYCYKNDELTEYTLYSYD